MRGLWCISILWLILAPAAAAQVTRTATFENFAAGTDLPTSFTDPLSGITFRNSTNPPAPGGFDINYYATYFGGGNYLTSGVIAEGGLGNDFGFTADLPVPAYEVDIDAIYLFDSRSNVSLEGFNSSNVMVAQQTGPAGGSTSSFPLQISSTQFDITTFRVSVGGGAAGYDNISFTIVPEPSALALCFIAGWIGLHRWRSSGRF